MTQRDDEYPAGVPVALRGSDVTKLVFCDSFLRRGKEGGMIRDGEGRLGWWREEDEEVEVEVVGEVVDEVG